MSKLIDIKYALRLLLKTPKFTAMTLGVLIGGLSISLFTFSFMYTTVYKPLPLPEGDTAYSVGISFNGSYNLITAYEYFNAKKELTHFEEFGIYTRRSARLSFQDSGKDLPTGYVRPGFFEFSRTKPIMGRTIQPEDTLIGATPVALISYEVWQSELNGDEDVLNKTMILNGEITNIIGIMPAGYRFPNTQKVWLPLSDEIFNATPEQSNYYYAYGRLKPGSTIEEGEQELGQAVNQIYQQNIRDYGLPELEKSAKLLTFPMAQTGGDGTIVFIFLNAIAWIILLLACINVGNLLLARSVERQKETAIRAALGAGSVRLISQLMWEGIIITVLGGILSLLLVGAVLEYVDIALKSWIPDGGSFWWTYGMDMETVLVGIGFTVITIFMAVFIPAWRSANQDINLALRDGTRGAQSKKSGRISRVMVTTQVFLVALLMLIGSISAFIAHKFINVELGDNFDNVINARFYIPEEKYAEETEQLALVKTITEQIKQHPNVIDVITSVWYRPITVTLEDVDYGSEADKPQIDTIGIIGDTATIGVNLVSGRQLNESDTKTSRLNVMISQSMANRYWPAESPLEKSFTMTINEKEERVFVVGVVTDRLNQSTLLGKIDGADEIYISGQQFVTTFQSFFYRVMPNTPNAEEIFYQAMFKTDRNIELLYSVEPAEYNRNKMRESMHLLSNVTFATGFFSLLLAMVGIYGLTANAIAQKTHEVGIRRAVGASDQSIIRLFLKQGARQLFIGLGLALIIFALIANGFHHFTDGLFPIYIYFTQALTVVIGLSAVVMFAIYVPTTKAVKMEPSVALRYE